MKSLPETPLFFGHGANRLFGVVHEPRDAVRAPAFVFCLPFGEEKLWAHRVFVAFARELARRGHPVLRFDYRGNGDSEGDFSDTSLETNLADIETAIAFLKARTAAATVALLGLRLGAMQAALVAARRNDLSTLVLWIPTTDGQRYIQELLRINLTTQLAVDGSISKDREALVADMRAGRTVNVDGYEVSLPLYEQISAVRLADAPLVWTGRCLIVQIERGSPVPPARDLVQLHARLAGADLLVVQEEPFWKEIQRFYEVADQLFEATLTWLEPA